MGTIQGTILDIAERAVLVALRAGTDVPFFSGTPEKVSCKVIRC